MPSDLLLSKEIKFLIESIYFEIDIKFTFDKLHPLFLKLSIEFAVDI